MPEPVREQRWVGPRALLRLPLETRQHLKKHGRADVDGKRLILDKAAIARTFGNELGYAGAKGGWIYRKRGETLVGDPVCQGWVSFYPRMYSLLWAKIEERALALAEKGAGEPKSPKNDLT